MIDPPPRYLVEFGRMRLRTLQICLLAISSSLAGCERFRNDPSIGAYRVDRVEGCADIIVGGNVVVPYGVDVVDCEGAHAYLQAFFDEKPYVTITTDDCRLHGVGEAAHFVCEGGSYHIADVVGPDHRPIRDDRGRIHAVVLQSLKDPPNLGYELVDRGYAVWSDGCRAKALEPGHYCGVMLANWERVQALEPVEPLWSGHGCGVD